MREVLRVMVSLLVVVTFVAVGISVALLFSLASEGGFGSMGIGPSPPRGEHDLGLGYGSILGGMSGFFVALTVVWGIYRNRTFFCWFGAVGISAPAILLACLIPTWGYPIIIEVPALLVPALCAGFLHSQAKAARQGGHSDGV